MCENPQKTVKKDVEPNDIYASSYFFNSRFRIRL